MEVTLGATLPLPAWSQRLRTKQKVIDKSQRTLAGGFGNLMGQEDKFGVQDAQASRT